MTKNSENVPAISKATPHDVPAQAPVLATLQYLCEPALLAHESRDEYRALQNEFFTELEPQGALEAQFVEDVLYATWEIGRLRQARTELISINMVAVGHQILGQMLRADPEFKDLDATDKTNPAASTMIKSAVLGDRQAFVQVEQLFARVNVTWAELYANAIRKTLPQLERIDRLMDRAERSRQSALKDFGFLQATKAMALEKRSNVAIEDVAKDLVEENSQ